MQMFALMEGNAFSSNTNWFSYGQELKKKISDQEMQFYTTKIKF